jgi:uncharacterized protein (DUF305 family)
MKQLPIALMFAAFLSLSAPAFAQGGSSQGYMDAMKKMQADMPKDQTGDSDVDFARNMIPHHQGAIDMAKVEVASGKDPMLKKMARKMIKDQEAEIAELQGWLKKRGK